MLVKDHSLRIRTGEEGEYSSPLTHKAVALIFCIISIASIGIADNTHTLSQGKAISRFYLKKFGVNRRWMWARRILPIFGSVSLSLADTYSRDLRGATSLISQ